MSMPSAVGCPIFQSGAMALLLSALVALAACTNAGTSASSTQSSPTPMASADGNSSVGKVSDALGQRLDGMLNSQHTVSR